MNYQTKEISDWLDKSGIVNSRREDISKLQKLVELSLLVKGKDIKKFITVEERNKRQKGELVKGFVILAT